MGADGDGRAEARAMLTRYLRQMEELGESEIYVSPEFRDELASGRLTPLAVSAPSAVAAGRSGSPASGRSDAPAARSTAGGSGAPAARSGAGSSGAAALAASMPEPEVVEVKLAVGGGAGTGDMFAQTSEVDGCSSLEDVERLALTCEKCELAQGRTKVVFGAGNPDATLMFVGEAPGRDEDLSGVPFVGRAGQLLDKILAAADIARDSVYIGNIIKCRPPNNRTPLTSEIEACMPYLAKQLSCIKPSIICTLGLPATHTLLGLKGSMGSMRGKLYRAGDIVVVPTYHPAAALRDPKYKKPIWEDFLLVKREYDRARGRA